MTLHGELMSRYRNIRTGAVVETDCACRGVDWQEETPVCPLADRQKEASAQQAAPAKKVGSGARRAVKKNG